MNDFKTAFERLVSIMLELREKCPWDQKQSNESLRYLTLEECYEPLSVLPFFSSHQDVCEGLIQDLSSE